MQLLLPPGTPEGLGFAPAYQLGPDRGLLFLSGCPGYPIPRSRPAPAGIADQVATVFANMRAVVEAAGGSLRDVVKVTRFMRDTRDRAAVRDGMAAAFGDRLVASTLLELHALSEPDVRLEMDAWAAIQQPASRGGLTFVDTAPGLPNASGVLVGPDASLVALEAVHPTTAGGPQHQVTDCLQQIERRLSQVGFGRGDLVKVLLNVADPRDSQHCFIQLTRWLAGHRPALTIACSNRLGTPDARVEVEAWAARADPTAPTRRIEGGAQLAPGARLLLMSGQAAIPVYGGGQAADVYRYQPPGDIRRQLETSLDNYARILAAAGLDFDSVFKVTWYLSDLREWETLRPMVEARFGGRLPPSTVTEVSKFVLPGVRLEPDMWAVLP